MRSNTRRSQLDHERYMAHREERKAKQRDTTKPTVNTIYGWRDKGI